MEGEPERVLHLSFNQDGGCFAVSTTRGFRVFNSDPFKETVRAMRLCCVCKLSGDANARRQRRLLLRLTPHLRAHARRAPMHTTVLPRL